MDSRGLESKMKRQVRARGREKSYLRSNGAYIQIFQGQANTAIYTSARINCQCDKRERRMQDHNRNMKIKCSRTNESRVTTCSYMPMP
jgi:hypothetical protein